MAHGVGWAIESVDETGSTNSDMLVRAGQGAGEGHWILAARQTAGRGRLGRAWQGLDGNVFASTLVRIRPTDPPAAGLSMLASLALHETLSALPGAAQASSLLALKWPNDVMLGGGKLSGILLERAGDAVVIGIGVNLAAAPVMADRATACLADHGILIAPLDFVRRLAPHVANALAQWRQHGAEWLHAAWQAHAHPLGAPLCVTTASGEAWSGAFAGLAGDGGLRLLQQDGSVRILHAGDVALIGDAPHR